jgi:DegV family protein with EDD domain
MMTIRIVTDSTCDLPEVELDRHGISVIPLYINIDDQGYLDGIDISREEFYRRLPEFDPPPTTAAPAPEVFRSTYERLAEEGASQILSLHISKSLSATIDAARLGASETTALPVTVFDSRQLSLGTGFLAVRAAQEAAAGRSMEEILAALNDQISRTHVFAALDTLEFLKRSGRMSWAMAGLGSLLQIKPLLKMHEGNPTSERVRTRNGATRRLLDLLEARKPFERVAVVHTHASDRAEQVQTEAVQLLPDEGLLSVDITPVIGAHIGPGAVGFTCITAKT